MCERIETISYHVIGLLEGEVSRIYFKLLHEISPRCCHTILCRKPSYLDLEFAAVHPVWASGFLFGGLLTASRKNLLIGRPDSCRWQAMGRISRFR